MRAEFDGKRIKLMSDNDDDRLIMRKLMKFDKEKVEAEKYYVFELNEDLSTERCFLDVREE